MHFLGGFRSAPFCSSPKVWDLPGTYCRSLVRKTEVTFARAPRGMALYPAAIPNAFLDSVYNLFLHMLMFLSILQYLILINFSILIIVWYYQF